MIINLSNLTDLPQAAQEVLNYATEQRVFLFSGEMGAGKTTFIKALCSELGVEHPVSSPTFALVNEYAYPGGSVYHFDCYRLKKPEEALDLGFEEYINSGQYCFIEWPEQIEGLWPEQYVWVDIRATGTDSRQIELKIVG
ncbi:MAG: tRNA (adenosine(37)-N6)-threonylcarbamoyltransferase complex ATPase subunit type 1 TsaE [Sediminibacterium sp.]